LNLCCTVNACGCVFEMRILVYGPEGQELPMQTFVLNLPFDGILVVHEVEPNTLSVRRPVIIFCTTLKTVFLIFGIFVK